MTKINNKWNKLEADKSANSNVLLTRYSATVYPDVFIGLYSLERLKCIGVRLENNNSNSLSKYSRLKDIRLVLLPDDKEESKAFLLIILNDPEHEEIFATLCEDLISAIAAIKDEKIVVRELLNRFEKWTLLFEKALMNGLSPEEQRGLFGELYFLKKWILSSSDHSKCVQSWVGPEKAIRDFQLSDWALEIKATHGNNHQKIHISSERQLDTANLSKLFLLHVSLEAQQQNGDTLNTLADELIALLNTDIPAQSQFKTKLLHAGYFNHHRPLYENTGYQIRQHCYYQVSNNFPRIEEKDVRKGVGDVKYSIILSEYIDYIISESSVFETIS